MKAAYGLFQRATSDLGMDAVGSGATALCFREARAASRGQPVFLRLDFACEGVRAWELAKARANRSREFLICVWENKRKAEPARRHPSHRLSGRFYCSVLLVLH